MDKSKSKTFNLKRRQRRVRAKVSGTPDRPRLRVTRSNAHIYAQVIDDVSGRTLCSCSSLDKEKSRYSVIPYTLRRLKSPNAARHFDHLVLLCQSL